MILSILRGANILFAAALIVLATAGPQLARAEVMAEIEERGVLRVGTSLNLPWAMRDAHGELFGFEIDNASRLASDLGVALELVELPFGELLDALENGTVDVVAAGLSITPERARRVAFSAPYMTSDVGVVVRVTDLAERADILGFNQSDVTVAAVAGTTTEIAALHALPSASLQPFATVGASIEAFLDGETTVLVGETPVPELLLFENPDVFTLLPESLLSSGQAFAVRRDEHAFHTYLDNWVSAYETAGMLDRARRYWFAEHEWLGRLDELLVEVAIDPSPAAE
jgi:polar amino acid transport system substrate-binding protein